MLAPGCIIPEAEVKARDPHGRYWVREGPVKGYIHPDYIPSGWQSRTGNKVVNLVCLAKQRSQPFAITNYESSLIQYFYSRQGRIVEEAHKSDIWVPRWRESAVDPLQVSCSPSKPTMTLPPSPECRQWQFVGTSKWLMPIATSQYLAVLMGSSVFCPSALQHFDFPYVLPATYTNELNENLPLNYQSRVLLPHESKRIRIYLHGFLQPLKWHHVIWRHMLSGMEKVWWASWLGYPTPSDDEVSKIFQGCEEKTAHICHCCSQEQFRRVHAAIRDLANKQWGRLVTLWESTSTKKVFINQTTFGFAEVAILVSQIHPFQISGNQVYPVLIFQGWSYDWDDEGGQSILHINPSTFFLSKKPYTYVPFGLDYLEGELENVNRA